MAAGVPQWLVHCIVRDHYQALWASLVSIAGKQMAETLLSAIRAMSGAGSLAELQATLNHSDTEAQVPWDQHRSYRFGTVL